LSSGLDELERRGRWGRQAAAGPSEPLPAERAVPKRKPSPTPTAGARPKAKVAPEPAPAGVERVVVYLSRAQTAWIRERQIEALRAGKRISTSKLIRELMDRAMS
jgi:hypothetical protein